MALTVANVFSRVDTNNDGATKAELATAAGKARIDATKFPPARIADDLFEKLGAGGSTNVSLAQFQAAAAPLLLANVTSPGGTPSTKATLVKDALDWFKQTAGDDTLTIPEAVSAMLKDPKASAKLQPLADKAGASLDQVATAMAQMGAYLIGGQPNGSVTKQQIQELAEDIASRM